MKNSIKLLIVTAIMMVATLSQAQRYKKVNYEYQPGDIELQVGIGLMSTFVSANADTRILPVSAVINYRVKQHFSLGAYMGYSQTAYKDIIQDKNGQDERLYLRNNFYLAGLRAEGHWNKDRIDFYGGAMIGYNFSNIETNITDLKDRPEGITIKDGSSLVTYSGYIGLKYAASEHLGIYGEIGHGVSLVNLGLSFRL